MLSFFFRKKGFTPHQRHKYKYLNELDINVKENSLKPRMLVCGAGFTLLEILIVVAIIGIMAALVGGNLQGARERGRLEEQAQKFIGVLEEARSSSVGAKKGRSWGVEFDGGEYKLFSLDHVGGKNYEKTESLPSAMSLSSGEVSFEKLTGIPKSTPTITLQDDHFEIKIEITHESIKKGKIEKV